MNFFSPLTFQIYFDIFIQSVLLSYILMKRSKCFLPLLLLQVYMHSYNWIFSNNFSCLIHIYFPLAKSQEIVTIDITSCETIQIGSNCLFPSFILTFTFLSSATNFVYLPKKLCLLTYFITSLFPSIYAQALYFVM